ncbi:MAG: hypothetical protein KF708_06950 [Pirellulales bacterium]|nr:hypothetical protein [Pirellulales bacterium]
MSGRNCIRFRGREEPILGERFVGRRKYLLLKRLNAHDGEAYRAFDPHAGPGGDYRALHVLPRTRATKQRIDILRRLGERGGHFPNLVDYARDAHGVTIVFSWVHGPTLREYFEGIKEKRFPRPSAVEATRMITRLAHGLAQFHGKRLAVHGDIKPANLIVAREPYRLTLIDFGSAWPVERTRRREPGDGVSAPYAAPEQLIDGGFVDWRADLFALSVVWYQLLTLEVPYDGMGGRAGLPQFRGQFADTLQLPSQLSTDAEQIPRSVWAKIDAAIARGLALDADDRFLDRSSWLDALQDIQSEARSPTPLSGLNRRLLSWLEKLLPGR